MKKFINGIFKGIEILITLCLAAMIGLMFMNIIMRYIFNRGFVWSEEIARICFIYLVYLGSIEAAKDNRHLLIDSVLLKFKGKVKGAVYIVIQMLIIFMMGLLCSGSWGLMMQNLHDRWSATQFPVTLVYLPGLILGIGIIIISLTNVIDLITRKKTVEELIAVPVEDDDSFSDN